MQRGTSVGVRFTLRILQESEPPALSRPSTSFPALGGEGGATEFVYPRAHPSVFALPVLRQETSRSGFTLVLLSPLPGTKKGFSEFFRFCFISEFFSFFVRISQSYQFLSKKEKVFF